MKKTLTMIALLLLCGLPVVAQQGAKAGSASGVTSVYTDLSGSNCKTMKLNEQEGWSIVRCLGVGGYKLLVADADARQSITVVTPDNKEHELSYWQTITVRFSTLGDKAEWRVKKQGGKLIPIALIVRVNAAASDDGEPAKSYLAVAKITQQATCVTDRIEPGANANEQARRAADASATKPCRQDVDTRVSFQMNRR
jgi:hypothetical protein